MQELSAERAWRNLNQGNPHSRWKSFVIRATDGAILAASPAQLAIGREDAIFCIGSCFARNIELKLVAAGFRVLSHTRFAPADGSPFAPLPYVFNVRSIINELQWGLNEAAVSPEACFVSDPQGFVYDPHATVDTFRGPEQTVRERRAGVTANTRRLPQCRVIVMTLGLVEVWFDRRTDMYLNATLPQFLLEREPDRYVLRVLDYNDCLAGLEEVWSLLERHGHPDLQLVLSVSPVPAVATFCDRDVLVAHNYSKSTQVAAAQDFAARHDRVHYFASFESVMASARAFAWKNDLRHINSEMVDRVTGLFLEREAGARPTGTIATSVRVATDWPVDSEIKRVDGLPLFASSVPGDAAFPAGFPLVTASSVLDSQFDPSCMMSASKRIWHAARAPEFPQWLEFRFERELTVERLYVQSQDAHFERAPGRMRLDAMQEGRWAPVLDVPAATWSFGGEWQYWTLAVPAASTSFRLVIFSNSGDPDLLTVQKVYLKP